MEFSRRRFLGTAAAGGVSLGLGEWAALAPLNMARKLKTATPLPVTVGFPAGIVALVAFRLGRFR
jgi:hypothetical protein